MSHPIRVLIADDSAFMRRALRAIIEKAPDMAVVGAARNGAEALELARALCPDVMTLDLNMPVMDGLDTLAHLMAERPMAVVVISSLTHEGALATFEALELGAVDYVPKSGTIALEIGELAEEIVGKVRNAARARVRRGAAAPAPHAGRVAPPAPAPGGPPCAVVAIGVSTGGPATLMEIVPRLPADFRAAVVIAQHMPPKFTLSFARHLDEASELPAREAQANEPLLPGHVYVAPGGFHLTVARSVRGRGLLLRLGERARREELLFCPSVDVLFDSVAAQCGARCVGVLLTGMGADGAEGMVRIRAAGGFTIAESEATAIVFGMPRAAIERGGAELVAPCHEIAGHIRAIVRRLDS